MLVLMDLTVQSVLFQQDDECNGLYIIQRGHLAGYLYDRNDKMINLNGLQQTPLVGEVSFFLKTKRTASIYCKSSIRSFFLDIRSKKTFHDLCPKLHKRMRNQIFTYQDECLEYKVKILKESVFYFHNVEREALVELSFQMKILAFQKDN